MKKTKNRERANRITFYLNDNELKELNRKMELLGSKNREAIIRKILSQCYLVHLDMKPIQELVRLTRKISENVNQVSRRANECGGVYENDVLDLLREVNYLKPLIAEAYREVIRICN